MVKNILITGGAGYIGTALVEKLVKEGHNITIYDSIFHDQKQAIFILDNMLTQRASVFEALLNNSHHQKIPQVFKNFRFIEGDVRDKDLLKKTFSEGNFDYVFHFGELVGHYCCEKDPNLTKNINYEGTKGIVDLAIQHNAHLIYNSSSSVYGSREDPEEILDETAQLFTEELDTYCLNKLLSEDYILKQEAKHKLFNYIIFRPATVGGLSPRMRLTLLPNHFTYALTINRKLTLAQPDNYRAVIDMRDMVDAYVAVIKSPSWHNGVFNLGHHNKRKRDYVGEIAKIIGQDNLKINAVATIGKERNLKISSKKFTQAYGFTPSHSFRETILPLIKLLKEDPSIFSANNFKGVINTHLQEWKMLLE